MVFSTSTPLVYLIFPPLIWAALRFWQPGATGTSLIVAGVAIAFTEADMGPFAGHAPDDRLLLAQTFVGAAGVTGLVLAAVITERRRVEDIVEYIADTLQESLLPSRLPEIPGVQAAVDFRPASERHIVGGDFYDLFQADDGSWAIVVGDVCGKGAPAAAVTGLARYTLRAAAIQESRPEPGARAPQRRDPAPAAQRVLLGRLRTARAERRAARGRCCRTAAIRCRSWSAPAGRSSRSARTARSWASPGTPI